MSLIKKYHLEYFCIDRERIEKFDALFQEQTEVTYEVCVTHPDIFSFGLQGLPLVPYAYKSYVAEIGEATHIYYSKINEIRQIYGKKWIGPSINPDPDIIENKHTGLFTWAPPMPSNVPRPLTPQEMDILNEKLQEAKYEYCLLQAIAFYNANEENRRVTTRARP